MVGKMQAEVIALRALAWIAGEEDRLGGFLAATGTSPADLRDRAQDPDFLAAVLDYLLQDDAAVVAFCTAEGIACDAPAHARIHLPGGEAFHWT